jgi:hypothetical protein
VLLDRVLESMTRAQMIYVYVLSISMIFACKTYAMDTAKKEIDFEQYHLMYQRKILERKFPDYVAIVAYDCTVIAKQYVCTMFDKKEERKYKNMPSYECTMQANQYSIQDARKALFKGMSDYTRDYSKRKDGQLNPDQLIECTVRFGAPLSCEHTFDICVGDASEVLEKTMTDHFQNHLKVLNQGKK